MPLVDVNCRFVGLDISLQGNMIYGLMKNNSIESEIARFSITCGVQVRSFKTFGARLVI